MESLKELYKIGRGPSSSHTMGPEKAAKYLLTNYPQATLFEITLYGSLALTGKGHLTDVVLKEELKNNVKIIFDYHTKFDHPNTFIAKVYLENKIEDIVKFVSIGGGSLIINDKEKLSEEIYPFKSFKEIKEYCFINNLHLDEIVDRFENIDDYLSLVLLTMRKAIERGLKSEGILPGPLKVARKAKIIHSYNNNHGHEKAIQLVSSYAYAVSEENAAGNVIVTAPTCGSSGVLPSILYYYHYDKNVPLEKIIKSLKVAGIIGNVIKTNASISGAYAGCQSEIGSACAMSAAAVAYLENGDINQIEYAAENAMEHHLGLTCDPVKGLVQIPCIERNAVGALRAIDSAYLAKILTSLSKVSFDTVVKTMYQTGKDLKSAYKETSLGGLAKYYDKRN